MFLSWLGCRLRLFLLLSACSLLLILLLSMALSLLHSTSFFSWAVVEGSFCLSRRAACFFLLLYYDWLIGKVISLTFLSLSTCCSSSCCPRSTCDRFGLVGLFFFTSEAKFSSIFLFDFALFSLHGYCMSAQYRERYIRQTSTNRARLTYSHLKRFSLGLNQNFT